VRAIRASTAGAALQRTTTTAAAAAAATDAVGITRYIRRFATV